MAGVNKVILIGNLGKDPETVTFVQDKRAEVPVSTIKKTSFPLATTEVRRNRDGEKIEQTDWHNVVCWKSLADSAEKKLRKGSHVYIEGRLQSRSWEDREGKRHYITEVVAESFIVLSNRNRNEERTPETTDPYASILNEDVEPLQDLPF
ncbi:MAG: single-stranded DNA-binding protein [Bacteroidales bacterium]|nr:single-stranded DNA-binding protein [Bacteroidales bacterium]